MYETTLTATGVSGGSSFTDALLYVLLHALLQVYETNLRATGVCLVVEALLLAIGLGRDKILRKNGDPLLSSVAVLLCYILLYYPLLFHIHVIC